LGYYYTARDWPDDHWNVIGWTDQVMRETNLHISLPQCASELRVLHPSDGLGILFARVTALCFSQSIIDK
jgi:hypothetical protein